MKTATILAKAFCPTGPGGGIDNSCSPAGQAAAGNVRIVGSNPRFHAGPGHQAVAPLQADPAAAERVRGILAKHDPAIVNSLDAVVVMKPEQFKGYGRQVTGSETVQGWYDPDSRRLYFPANASEMTINHEMGHAAYALASQDWHDYWESNFNPTERLTKYAHDGEEQFAEAYAAYVKTGGKAQKTKYRELFSDVKKTLASIS